MRNIVLLSAVMMAAGVVMSPVARADTPDWYLGFEKSSCERMPDQAGCIGFRKPVAEQPAAQPVKKQYMHHRVQH